MKWLLCVSRSILPGSFIKSRAKTIYLYLCRHGQSDYNAKGLLQGQLDNPLTALGKEQAALLACRAKEWDISTLISSPLGRAKQTADICAQTLNLNVAVQIGFEERHYGQWQGSPICQLDEFEHFKQRCYLQPDLIPCMGAESTETVRNRMTRQLKLLSQKHITGNILLISHGDAIDCLLSMCTTPKTITNGQHLRFVKMADNFVWDQQ
jgi:probable phosphoglycerate mutase